jgi:CBS domain-containing protein
MEDLYTFLRRHPPFDALDSEELRRLATTARTLAFAPGARVLVEDGPPADGLWVLVAGSLDLLHEGQVVQGIEPGECFGHPSLLTGLSPAFTVRAREPSTCALFPREGGDRILGTRAGAAYIAMTMRKRLTRTGQTVHGLLDISTAPASAIMRPPRYIDPAATALEAAAQLNDPGTTALLVALDDGGLGLVTDAEIRRAAAGGATRLQAPVRDIARTAVPTVPASQLAIETTVDMVAASTAHAAVIDGGRVCGVLGAEDVLGLEARSPIALRHTIFGASDERELERAASRLPRLLCLLVEAGIPARDIGRVLTLQHDAVVSRLIDFALQRQGPAPVSWAWLDLGSAARREFTLGSDQDNALAYATPPEGRGDEVDAWFAELGQAVNDGLARCGIGTDNNGVLAGQRLWRMSRDRWLQTFAECLREPNESHLVRATVAFDFRATAGGLAVAAELTEQIRAARQYPGFMRLLARTAGGFPVALNRRGQLAGDRDGRIDLKRGGIVPLVNLVRFHALANGVTISPTLDRIDAVESLGGLDADAAEALRDVFEVIMRVRFDHHAAAIAAGEPVDNLIDPSALTPVARSELREALAVVRRGQRKLGVWTPAVSPL